MNCNKTQKLLLTDYIDGEINERLLKKVENHLLGCNRCRQFLQTLQKRAIEPFRKNQEVQVPEELWQRIKNTIKTVEKEQTAKLRPYLLSGFRFPFRVPRPVFSVIAAVLVIVVSVIIIRVSFNKKDSINIYLQEQLDFLSSLSGDYDTEIFDTDAPDLGTKIEKYLM